MDFHPWIQAVKCYKIGCCRYASMLPWIFIHGYISTCLGFRFGTPASMLPWIFIHGYSEMPARNSSMYEASMLPWIFIHGYSVCVRWDLSRNTCFNVAMDFHPWIRGCTPKSWASTAMLQCCHGFSSMDTGLNDGIIAQVGYFTVIRGILINNSFSCYVFARAKYKELIYSSV